jgi:hypothetical protein
MDTKDYIQEHALFYRDGYRRLLIMAFALTILVFLQIALIFYQYNTRPIVKYFATTSNGQLIEIFPS